MSTHESIILKLHATIGAQDNCAPTIARNDNCALNNSAMDNNY